VPKFLTSPGQQLVLVGLASLSMCLSNLTLSMSLRAALALPAPQSPMLHLCTTWSALQSPVPALTYAPKVKRWHAIVCRAPRMHLTSAQPTPSSRWGRLRSWATGTPARGCPCSGSQATRGRPPWTSLRGQWATTTPSSTRWVRWEGVAVESLPVAPYCASLGRYIHPALMSRALGPGQGSWAARLCK